MTVLIPDVLWLCLGLKHLEYGKRSVYSVFLHWRTDVEVRSILGCLDCSCDHVFKGPQFPNIFTLVHRFVGQGTVFLLFTILFSVGRTVP